MKHQIRRIGALSAAKIAFFVYWALGILMTLFYGLFFALISLIDPSQFDPDFGEMSRFVGGLGAMMILLLGFFISIFYALMGAVGTALMAVAYNLLAKMVGGVELELEFPRGIVASSLVIGAPPTAAGASQAFATAPPATAADPPPAATGGDAAGNVEG